ncbi:TIGR02449 family protein [Ectothiorhodospiraceae bacterium 2226]|nr:TIGR02449 family protein [Ectothiorhodospiraceae bacterium 2226]
MPEFSPQPKTPSLARLEAQVDALLSQLDRLAMENQFLREREQALVAERAQLIEKAELARSRVEAMITRLRAMEQEG